MSVLIVVDARQIVTPSSYSLPQRGKKMQEVKVWKNSCISIDTKTGKILAVGLWKRVKVPGAKVIQAKESIVFPGFVDSHTHPLYSGSRVGEFILRSQGVSYMDILKEGGGILSTVNATRKAKDSELFRKAAGIFQEMLLHGTTTVEAKTGYGLSSREEIRQLKILQELRKKLSIEIFPTFLGAHAVPPEYNADEYVELVCKKMLPEVARNRLAVFCDVFCEKGVFSVEQSREILETARKFGMGIRLHADEFESIGGAELGASLGAYSADHLMGISENGITALATSDTAAVLLPCTSFSLAKERYAPARELIDSGAVVALATDFNAGSNLCFSMQMAASLGILQMRMTPEEAVVASTLHGAHALGVSDRIGGIHPGKQADLIFLSGDDYREMFYRFGANQAKLVIKKGKVVR